METPAHRLAAVTLQAAWLVPYEKHLAWMVPAAVVLLVPCFALSVFVEDWSLGRRWPDLASEAISAAVPRANAWSCVLLALAGGRGGRPGPPDRGSSHGGRALRVAAVEPPEAAGIRVPHHPSHLGE